MKRIVVIMLMLLYGSATFAAAFSPHNCTVSCQSPGGHFRKSPDCCSHQYSAQDDCCGDKVNLIVTDKQKFAEPSYSGNKKDLLHTFFRSFYTPDQSTQVNHQWQPKTTQLPVSSLYILHRVFRL